MLFRHAARGLAFGLVLLAHAAVAQVPSVADDPTGEIGLWQVVARNNTRADYETYLKMFPDGRFVALARVRLGLPPVPAAPSIYHLTASPPQLGMGQVVTLKCDGFPQPALFDQIVVVRSGAADFTPDGQLDPRQSIWTGLVNLYDCAGAGFQLPLMLAGAYEARYISRAFNQQGRLEVIARTAFVYR